MSFRFATLPPTCLSSRLARTRPHLCFLSRYALVANQSSIAVAPHRETTQDLSRESTYKRDVRFDGSELPDRHSNSETVPVGVLPIETTRPQRRVNDEKELTLLSQVLRLQEFLKNQPPEVTQPSWPDDWQLMWEQLHADFLDIRCLRTNNIQDIWHNHRDFAKSFIGQLDASGLKQKWKMLRGEEKGATLPRLLAGSLAESAAQTLLVLSNVDIQPKFNFRIRMQCLRHIHLTHIHELYPGSEARRRFEAEITLLRSVEKWPIHDISVPHLDILFTWSDPQQCDDLIKAYQKNYPFARPASLLPIVMSHIKHGNIETAFAHFQELPEDMLQHTAGFVPRLRDLLLKHDTVTKTEMGSNFRILPQMLALGIQPDASLHNAVIEAALANEVPDVAWDLYYHLKSSKLEVNARTHLVLLKDAFQRGQIDAVNNVMTSIHEDKDLVKDRYLIAYSMNVVRVVCFFERKSPPEESLSHILALYDRAYNRAPLYQLGILNENNRNEENILLPNPGPDSLAFTIWSYILVQYSTEVVNMLWSWIRQLITKKEKDIVAVAKFEVVYNALILFYARTPHGMANAMQVLQYMLRSNLCAPSERTWSMLLSGFLRHQMFQEANGVLLMMRARGVVLHQLSQEHIPSNSAILQAMAADIEAMDERAMPAVLAQIMARSPSLRPSAYASEASPAAADSLELPKTWKGFADMHPSSDQDHVSANDDN